MKKFTILLVIGLFLCAVSTANATLLGIRNLAGMVPDVQWDAGGTATYDAINDIFTVVANDQVLYLEKPSLGFSLLGNVSFSLTAKVDNSGNLVPDTRNYMEERVINPFTFTWKNQIYSFAVGDLFLGGPVVAIGWDNTLSYLRFDWLFDPVVGKMVVDYNLWPGTIPTGAYLDTVNKSWNAWNEDLSVATEKGNKYPVPEPATMLLLGSGLLGIGVFVRRRFKK